MKKFKPFLEKSNRSLDAAKHLSDHGFYCDTISRAYYSCLQYILHVLFEKMGITQRDFMNVPRSGTHRKAQFLIEMQLLQANAEHYKWFQQAYTEFKQERVMSDYYGVRCDTRAGTNATRTAEGIKNILKRL